MGARLSFRSAPVGGPVRAQPDEQERLGLLTRRHLILLIHGYNNSEREADEAYRGFEAMQRSLAALPEGAPVAHGRLVDVYWPGDADWGIVSPLYYPGSIRRARETARALAATLREAVRASGYKRVDIVAHSMGCRLTLEVLKGLRGTRGLYVGRIALMAGAVPTPMLERGAGKGLREAWEGVLRDGALSLYSGEDAVLAAAFPLGQTLAGRGEGFFPTALGREHWVSANPPAAFAQHEVGGAGHSDYWGWNRERFEQGNRANRRVKDFLRLDEAGERAPASRATPERGSIPARETGEYREDDQSERW
jgi:pimeloyl-ACP methyl ester carboxylesterase